MDMKKLEKKWQVAAAIAVFLALAVVAVGLAVAPPGLPGQGPRSDHYIPDGPHGPDMGADVMYRTADGTIVSLGTYQLWTKNGCQPYVNDGNGSERLPEGQACLDVTADPNWRIAFMDARNGNMDQWVID